MKLWTIKNSECVKTFDEHDSKIWALAINRDENQVITGGADSTIIVWKVRLLCHHTLLAKKLCDSSF